MTYRTNQYFFIPLLIMLSILVVFGFNYFIINYGKFSLVDLLEYTAFLTIYLTVILNSFFKLDISENEIIRKRNTVIFSSRVLIPYHKILHVFRSFWFISYIYTIEAEIDGKRIWLHLNLFSRHKEILRKIVSKIDKSIVDEDVLKAIKQNVK